MFEQAYQFIVEQISKNDLVAGGAVLGALAYILNSLKRVPFKLLHWSRLAFVTEIDIPDKSDAFVWVEDWLASHPYSQKAKRVTVESMHKQVQRHNSFGSHSEQVGRGRSKVSPAPGLHLLWWRRRLLILRRVRREGTGDNAHRMYRESWAITMIGGRSLLNDFLDMCRSESEKDKDTHITVLEGDHGYWLKSSKRRKRPLDSVILPSSVKSQLMADLKEFITSEDWYKKMNIPWRRGYLFTGKPGNGKSSTVTAIASEIGFEIAMCNLRSLDEDDLVSLMADLHEGAILLLEDIDCVFQERRGEDGVKISLSALLNLLDGVNATEGRVVIMTTNHPEKLDPALIRPGRIDLHVSFDNASVKQAADMYRRFFPGCRNAEDFGQKVATMDVSMAKLQGYLLRYKHSMRDARTNVKELLSG